MSRLASSYIFVCNVSYASFFAVKLEKLPVNGKNITLFSNKIYLPRIISVVKNNKNKMIFEKLCCYANMFSKTTIKNCNPFQCTSNLSICASFCICCGNPLTGNCTYSVYARKDPLGVNTLYSSVIWPLDCFNAFYMK